VPLKAYLSLQTPSGAGDRLLPVAWHLGWAAFALLALIGLLLLPASLLILGALVAIAIPGALAVLLLSRDEASLRLALLWVWSACAAVAVILTGGIAGPAAAWCALPTLAAVVLNERRLISLGAAQSVGVALLATFISLSDAVKMPDEQESFWLSTFAVLSVVSGLGIALLPALRQRVERAAGSEEARARLLSLLTEQPALILSLDAAGKAVAAYGEAPAGLDINTFLNVGLLAAVHAPERPGVEAALESAFASGRAEIGFTPHGALDHYVQLSLRRGQAAEQGSPDSNAYVYGLLIDASLQHAREDELANARAEAEANSAGKTQFLASMSHELRTPLNAVIGFSDIMRQQLFGPMPEKYAEYSQLVWESGQHVLDMINDVLDMSKIEARKYDLTLEEFDMREPVSAALRLMRGQAHDKRVDIRSRLPGGPLEITADKRAVKQIALNLLSNAIKFTPDGGAVSLDLRQDGDVAELVISDTGIGIAPDDLGRLGQPYEQAGASDQKAMGTGLGLSIVKAMAALHRGTMTLESTLGEGTTVTVRLPVRQGFPVTEVAQAAQPTQTIVPSEALSVSASQIFADEWPLDFTRHETPGDFVIRPPRS
jgi:cell cycle sensor histidine kinase DivJ